MKQKKATMKRTISFLIFIIAVILLILLYANNWDVVAVVNGIRAFFS